MSMFYSWEIFHFGIVFGPEAKPVELNDKSIVIKFIPASIKPSKQEYKGDLDECYREAVFSSHTHNSPVLPALSSLSVPVRSSSDLWLTASDDRAFVSLTPETVSRIITPRFRAANQNAAQKHGLQGRAGIRGEERRKSNKTFHLEPVV